MNIRFSLIGHFGREITAALIFKIIFGQVYFQISDLSVGIATFVGRIKFGKIKNRFIEAFTYPQPQLVQNIDKFCG